MGAMDVQPYAPESSYNYPRHYLPNSHSYSYGYAGDDADDRGQSKRAAKTKRGGSLRLASLGWNSSDPEAKRKRRVAAYKRFDSRRRVGDSVKRGVRWIKIRCFRLCYRWW
ncbi:uncharacterized protein LOC112341493 [Selaginella moellendorffii]|uniref:uncharacterized protein LOC112341493 n=1 Tax=Selaginella moellendorffii TaxID=88036 RepID=UPI000D1C6269|nr:uncharacterized protein LOC112341493 [Selaginella moellendorffii]|eukprot:XP_024517452.1 uncharacterized protein LOC112341493 [Selaginella moellendorffii]